MVYRTTGKAIAEAIGVSPGRVSQLRREGMPDSSIEAAVAWYRRRVNPARSTGQRFSHRSRQASHDADGSGSPRDALGSTDALERVAELQEFARTALAIGSFEIVEASLRESLRAVRLTDRAHVQLDSDVWRALSADVLREIEADQADGGPTRSQMAADFEALTDEEKRQMAAFWYSVAAGEITVPGRLGSAGASTHTAGGADDAA